MPYIRPADVNVTLSTFAEQFQDAVRDQFAIVRELGGGGMSRVFLADERRLGRQVVIKTLPPDATAGINAERFAREIAVAARLQDPHVVPVIAAGVAAGVPYYTMPYVAGESLRARIAAGRVPLAEAVAILRDVAVALEHAHEHGIVHRDIKPENVLLARRSALVADFGIAKAISESTTTGDGRLTATGVALGTPGYLAPEQAAGDQMDHRADLYSWGVIAYELLSGAHPFGNRTSAQQMIAAHLTEKPVPLASDKSIPVALAALVMRCLEKNPADRPPSAADVVRTLDDWTLSAPTTVRAGRRKRAVAAVGAALLIVAGVVAIREVRGTGAPGPVAAAAGRDARTVAVLPFDNTGNEDANRYIADGITDELALALSKVPGVRVAARTSSYAFRGRTARAEDVGNALHVGSVIEGSVLRSGGRLRVIARLTSTSNGLQLWSDQFESSARDMFEVQDAVTKAIVVHLVPNLSPTTAAATAQTSRGTTNEEAYDTYLKARYFTDQRTRDGLERGVELYTKATEMDPGFANAFAGLAEALSLEGAFAMVQPRVAYTRSRPIARHALALDSTLAEPRISLGMISLFFDVDLPAARSWFDAALRIAPANATLHLYNSWYKLIAEGGPAAVNEAWVAQRLDPLSLIINVRVASMLRYARKYEDAARQLQRTFELDSTYAIAFEELAWLQASNGNYEASVASARHAGALGRDANAILGYSLAKAGHTAEAQRLIADEKAKSAAQYVPPSDIAYAYVGLGDVTSAVEWFRRCFEVRDHEMSDLKSEPLLDPIRADSRFQQLMARLP